MAKKGKLRAKAVFAEDLYECLDGAKRAAFDAAEAWRCRGYTARTFVRWLKADTEEIRCWVVVVRHRVKKAEAA